MPFIKKRGAFTRSVKIGSGNFWHEKNQHRAPEVAGRTVRWSWINISLFKQSGDTRYYFNLRLRKLLVTLKVTPPERCHRAGQFGIGSDDSKLEISIQKRPYDPSAYKSPARPSPTLIIDWSSIQVLLGPPLLLSAQAH